MRIFRCRKRAVSEPQVRLLARRLHLQHGPIDLIVEAFGALGEVRAAYRQAQARFATVLAELVEELALLQRPIGSRRRRPIGSVAARMEAAVWLHRRVFVTPMAAVAGAVADEVLAAAVADRQLAKAYVNNSGDIAVHLQPGQTLRLGIVGDLDRPAIDGTAVIEFGIGGVATSGWRGRSFSFGIADAVTVLARDAAAADVAATVIANAVNADHPAIARAPASSLDDRTDLGDGRVTTEVGPLDAATVAAALDSGQACADRLIAGGLICGAALILRGEARTVGAAERLRAAPFVAASGRAQIT